MLKASASALNSKADRWKCRHATAKGCHG